MMISRRLPYIYNLCIKTSIGKAHSSSTLRVLSCGVIVAMSRESHILNFFHQIRLLTTNNIASSSAGTSHTPVQSNEFNFSAVDEASGSRRPSTADDEAKVVALLKEILTYQESNMSNWIIESKVKSLCAAYTYLLKPHKEGFLKVLACNYAVDHKAVRKAAHKISILPEEETSSRQVIKLEEKLRNCLTPQYSWLFVHMGRLERGVKFLVDLRTDVLNVISQLEPSDDSALVPMQRLNMTLRELLSMWFSVGFLTLERVTWKSSCEMLQKISDYEVVHPVRSWIDLKRRVGPYRRCFVFTHNSMPDEPIVVLHTALCDEISSSMAGIVAAASRLSEDASATDVGLVGVHSETENPSLVKAAVFYSITSTQKGLKGIELGNYLIKRAAQEVQAEFPQVSQFSTLSPIPGFKTWLSEKLKLVEKGQNDAVTVAEGEMFQRLLRKEWVSELLMLLNTNAWLKNAELTNFLKDPLMRLCARYLYTEKHRNAALNSVAHFHLKNGAVMWRLNWQADLSGRGLSNSCGMMVNYRYVLEDTESNSRSYIERHYINASEQVSLLAANAERVSGQLLSKM